VEDLFIDLGISALLRLVKNKKSIDKYLKALAKVYDAIHRAAQAYPPLAAAIDEKQESKA
jgi:hypothetical protein